MSLYQMESRQIDELITEGYEDLVVSICRGVTDGWRSVISIDYLEDSVMWDSISGGVKRRQPGYSLYAYIPYNIAAKLAIGCSGMHDFGYNDAKIMIPRGSNREERFRAGYKELESLAGEKPVCHYRSPGLPPCTRRIEELLHQKDYTRSDLRETLFGEGYDGNVVRYALNILAKQKRIRCEGTSHMPYQILYEGENSFLLNRRQRAKTLGSK